MIEGFMDRRANGEEVTAAEERFIQLIGILVEDFEERHYATVKERRSKPYSN